METEKRSQLFRARSPLLLKASQSYCVISRFIPFASFSPFFVECEFALNKTVTGRYVRFFSPCFFRALQSEIHCGISGRAIGLSVCGPVISYNCHFITSLNVSKSLLCRSGSVQGEDAVEEKRIKPNGRRGIKVN